MKKILLYSTIVAVIFGIFLRLEGVFTNSFAFTYDVGRDMLAVSALVYQHKVSLIGFTTGLPGVFYGPWWYWILSPAFFLSQGNPQAVAFYMALFGIATIILGFTIGRKLGNSSLGLLLAALCALSPSLISLSSQIWNPNIIPFFLFSLVWLVGIIYEKKKVSLTFGFCIGLLLSLIMDLEIVFGILLIISTLATAIIFLRKFFSLQSLCAVVIGFFVVLLPRLLFDMRHQFLMTKSLLKLTSPEPGISSFNLLFQVQERAKMFFDLWDFTTIHNTILAGALLLGVIGILILFWKSAKPTIRFLALYSTLTISIYFFGLTFFRHMIFDHYIVGLPVFFILLTSLALFSLWNYGKAGKGVVLIILFVLFLVNVQPVQLLTSLKKPLWVGDASVYRNQIQVVLYIYKKAQGKKFKINVYTPPIYDYTYQYLFSWYGKRYFGYVPSQKANLAFFILEPDLQYPSRLADWLKIRQNDGKIIVQKKFPSGITIQERD